MYYTLNMAKEGPEMEKIFEVLSYKPLINEDQGEFVENI